METYNGHVRTPADAIILFEACRIGLLPRVQRRLSEKERQQIKSGSVFVWDEREAGMRRWTDGKSWSASRVSGSFLTYREMEGKRGGSFPAQAPPPKRPSGKSPDGSATGDSDGEGPDGYRYKPDGLMKQSFSITTSDGRHLHLISYYSRTHQGDSRQPTQDPQLRHIRPPKNMYPESTVNENTNVPAVTRGPMGAAPYAHSPQQIGSQSPYSRGAPSPHVPMMFSPYPGPPTPPYHPQVAIFQGPPHPHMPYGTPFYFHPGYAPQHPMTALDRAPPQLQNPHALPAHPGLQPHPHYPPSQQFVAHPGARAAQIADYAQHQAQTSGPPPASLHAAASLPETGPQLPAINGHVKQPSPQPAESKTGDSLSVPNNSSQDNAPSPGRIPNIHTLLNSQSTEASTDSKSNQPGSRSGSRSPGLTQRPPREMITGTNTKLADVQMTSKLNSNFV